MLLPRTTLTAPSRQSLILAMTTDYLRANISNAQYDHRPGKLTLALTNN